MKMNKTDIIEANTSETCGEEKSGLLIVFLAGVGLVVAGVGLVVAGVGILGRIWVRIGVTIGIAVIIAATMATSTAGSVHRVLSLVLFSMV
jgi:hypothetical protein